MNKQRILIVDDEPSAREGLAKLVSNWSFVTASAENGENALGSIAETEPHVVITDLFMPVMDGMTLLKRIKEDYPDLAVILLTAQATIDSAVEAIKVGAYDYLEKPVDPARLRILLDKCLEREKTLKEVQLLKSQLKQYGSFGDMAGSSPQMLEVYRLIEMVAPSTASVLITGESGTGKELVARNIHLRSKRSDGPFIAINCSAIPETLMESEIFGHEKGSFTGALERRLGCFELANGGTIFLDEIAEMPVGTQSKLLRVIEERKFRRLGSKNEIDVDVRIVAATNKQPLKAVESGELRNVVERSLIVCDKDLIEEKHLPVLEQREVAPSANSVAIPVGTTVAEAEKQLIYKTLEFTDNNKTRAAEILGVSLKTLHNKLNLYDAEAQN
ncbi:MAG: sigma-54-dependent Fis family transcriptional regulator [Acidimicrobiia bacterium]|nr:sigma-54-dependent Fis family transcriptional regulator [Acidimicrobiia bacterium]